MQLRRRGVNRQGVISLLGLSRKVPIGPGGAEGPGPCCKGLVGRRWLQMVTWIPRDHQIP